MSFVSRLFDHLHLLTDELLRYGESRLFTESTVKLRGMSMPMLPSGSPDFLSVVPSLHLMMQLCLKDYNLD